MDITAQQARLMLEIHGLQVPDSEIEEVALRFSTWLRALEEIEAEIGEQMDDVDPIAPVYPREQDL
jgi:hypothetical protein